MWVSLGLFYRDREQWAVYLLIAAVMGGGILAIAFQGTVRRAAVLVSVLVNVHHGRKLLTDALASQAQALAQAERIEAPFRLSEKRFAALFPDNPAATLVQHTQTLEVLDDNEAFVGMFGLNRQQLVGLNPSLLWADTRDRRRFQEQLVRQGRASAHPSIGPRPDGSTFEAQVFGKLVTQDASTLVILLVVDVSGQERARKAVEKSEERFSKVFHFSPLGRTIARLADGRNE